ncbi:MAG: hypothetical protein IT581_04015 [Verrucomicrobiales bacterium]|nr:hypothetical protein [Verrucomicrobiales bacterium]
MTDEPYRWLEAVQNRREYVETRLKGGSPAFAVSRREGVLLFAIGTGQSKVFEIHDRHALAGLGHPADLERVRQSIIDAAHLEAFTRAAEDVSLRRLVSFGLGPLFKTAFEQIYAPPIIARLVLAEVGDSPDVDQLMRLDFDGTFTNGAGFVAVSDDPAHGSALEVWLSNHLDPAMALPDVAALLYRAALHDGEGAPENSGPLPELPAGRRVEAALLQRQAPRAARYRALTASDLGLTPPSPR